MPNYDNHSEVIKLLKDAQESEHDMREAAREAHLFVTKRDGQWEPHWWDVNRDKPRYSFDLVNPIIDQVAGEMIGADFDIVINPAGGDASKDTAQILDGMVRNIENISGAVSVFNNATMGMLTGGVDGWRVTQKYVNDNSFDQDIVIEPIANYINRVWLDPSAEKEDKSDSRYGFVLQAMAKKEFEYKFKRDGQSVTTDMRSEAYSHKPEVVIVGEFCYLKEEERELIRMSDGSVYEADEDYNKVKDELAEAGITEVERRKRKKKVQYIRFFDNNGWLGEEKKTVFSYISIIPIYGNHKIYEDKTTYWGLVEKLMDPQRVLNYSLSREIEEGALAPRAKYWMTHKQAEGHERSLSTLNTNSDPVQFYNPDPQAPGAPMQQGGAQINPGLRVISEAMGQVIGHISGQFAANMGENPGLQSGIAIRQLQNKGDNGTRKYFKAREAAIAHTGRIIVDAIPRVYDTERTIRTLGEDGTYDMVEINKEIIDGETGKPVTLNDLSKGTYDVTCSSGPSFQNRQEELLSKIVDYAKVDPSVIEIGSDVLLNNLNAPGLNLIAERKRLALLQAGVIPEDQMTDEEREMMTAAAQNRQPDAATLLAQAEMEKAAADQQKVAADREIRLEELRIKEMGIQIEVEKLNQKDEDQMLSASKASQEFALKLEQAVAQIEKTNAETLKILRESMGVETIVGPESMEAYINQAKDISQNDR